MPSITEPGQLAALIDHTILRPDATPAQVRRFCDEAAQYGFHSVCVNPVNVPVVVAAGITTCSVVGFPFGASRSLIKAAEAAQAVAEGAAEIDMVLAVGALKDGDHAGVASDIAAVRRASDGVLLKVIIETCLLDDAEKEVACRLAAEAGADFVKTSTGYSSGGATVADVALMRAAVGERVGVKASGGIRDFTTAVAMVAAGATRLGVSAGVAIVTATAAAGGGY